MRRSTLIWTVLGVTVVVGLFVVKHEVHELENRLQALNAEIISDRDAVQVLQAEWAYLNQPSRLEALGTRLLGMESPSAGQTLSLADFLDRNAEPPAGSTQTEGTLVAARKPAPPAAPAAAPAPARVPAQEAVRTRAAPRAPAPPPVPAAVPVRAAAADDTDWLKPILADLKQSR